MQPKEEFLQLFDSDQVGNIDFGVQLLDTKIQELHEDEEKETNQETTYCASYIASVGQSMIAIMNMTVSNDGYEEEEDGELWKTALEKIGWKLESENDEFSMSTELRIYDFHKKIIFILDVICPTDGVSFSKYSLDFQTPKHVRDIANISIGEARCFEPDDEQKKLLIGVYRMMLRIIQPIGEHHRCESVSAPLLIQ